MSDPLRYDPGCEPETLDTEAVMFQCTDGGFVRWSDYARLKAEVDRLRASSFVTAVPSEEYEKLKAENERLRKAAISLYMEFNEFGQVSNSSIYALRDAAKDGKPTE